MVARDENGVSRRRAIALGLTAIGGVSMGYLARTPEAGHTSLQLEFLQLKPIAFGGGLSLLGPFKDTNGGDVFLRSIFAFGPNFVLCTVEDNPQGFVFPTATKGNVPLDPHSFFMYMGGSQIDRATYSEENGEKALKLTGHLDCHTEAVTVAGTLGARDHFEPADFEAEAVNGRSFSITVSFDKDKAPINSAIFGPTFTFKGNVVDGKMLVSSIQDLDTALSSGESHKASSGEG